MAISSQERRSKTLGLVEKGLRWRSWKPWVVSSLRKCVLGCRMTRWGRSTREGSICRTKRVGANLTYLFAASVKSEGVQIDMVTVRTIIKGLHR